jgi:ABC-2 type transport system permease protein
MSTLEAGATVQQPTPAPQPPAVPAAVPAYVLAAGTRVQPRTGVAGALSVMGAMLRMSMIEAKRYYFNSLVRLVSLYAFFFVVFMGAWTTMGDNPAFGASLSGIVVGLMVWMLAMRAYSDHSNRLNAEATQGTLEQLAMSPIGLARVLVYNMGAMMFAQMGFMFVFLVLMMATTRQWLHMDVLSLVPLLVLTMLGVHGMGLAMGGLALVFKRVAATTGIFQYVFLMLIAVPIGKAPVIKFLPLSWGALLIRRVMVDGTSLVRMPAADVLFLAANSLGYFAVGMLIFKMCERAARNRGMLGHY